MIITAKIKWKVWEARLVRKREASSAGKIKRTLEIVGSFQNYTSFWSFI